MFAGINMFRTRLRLILARAARHHFGGHWEKKTEKVTTKQFDQSRAIYKLNGFYFPSTENTQKLARNYKILPFEFSKIVENMKVRQRLFKSWN